MMTRGIKQNVDHYIADLQMRLLKHKIIHKGKKVDARVQLGVRPIQLWEVVFPEDELQEVLAMTLGESSNAPGYNNTDMIVENWRNSIIRKALMCKPLPKNFPISSKDPFLKACPVFRDSVSVHPIGIKEDKKWPEGHDYAGTEML